MISEFDSRETSLHQIDEGYILKFINSYDIIVVFVISFRIH